MLPPIAVVDIELSQPLTAVVDLAGYSGVQAIIRWHGRPVDSLALPVVNGECPVGVIQEAVVKESASSLAYWLLREQLLAGFSYSNDWWQLAPPSDGETALPLVTVAVCTRDRADDLARCLAALQQLDYEHVELLVVDNAPSDETTAELVQRFSDVRYVRESRPGLDWARNRAIAAANGAIIAYTDDDVIVDKGWVSALVQPFLVDESVMAVTGLVVPYELETEAQHLFEQYGGFSRGYERQWHRVNPYNGREWEYRGTGRFGTGANMAYRRLVFEQIGGFDPALDVGTVTNGGGDLEMFFRVLKEGHTLVYDPAAMVRHRHRRTHEQLQTQIGNNGVGLYAFWMRSAWAYREERRNIWRIGVWWGVWWLVRRLILAYLRPNPLPRAFVWGEIVGAWQGLFRYRRARREAAAIADSFDDPPLPAKPQRPEKTLPEDVKTGGETAVVFVDVSQPVTSLTGIEAYAQVRIYVTVAEQLLGEVLVYNCYRAVSAWQLADVIAAELRGALLSGGNGRKQLAILRDWQVVVRRRLVGDAVTYGALLDEAATLPVTVPVSIVLATYDRPEGLAHTLTLLTTLQTSRPVQIIVVDNHPHSGVTPPVVAQFPQVQLVAEPRQGLAYARNAGIRASTGEIIIMTDDDVMMPPYWLEKLVAPFAAQDVMAVTGNVLPAELETGAQRMFEAYGGLGRGFERRVADAVWFEKFRIRAVPTWRLGATANAAFRATVFADSQVGLMDEALGPGLPSGVGEDTYLFYKILQRGHRLLYEPAAYVQHTHRRSDKALRRQLYNYSKGHVAYHLTTWWRDGDWRGLLQLGLWVPFGLIWRAVARVTGRGYYPLRLLLLELWGNMVGPVALLRSWWRVWRERG